MAWPCSVGLAPANSVDIKSNEVYRDVQVEDIHRADEGYTDCGKWSMANAQNGKLKNLRNGMNGKATASSRTENTSAMKTRFSSRGNKVTHGMDLGISQRVIGQDYISSGVPS